MYDKLFGALNGLTHFKTTLQHIENVLDIIDANYLKDGDNARNVAIDTICQILQSHKTA